MVWIDVVLVGALVSSSAAGVYAAVSRLVLVGTLGLAALVLVLGPVLSPLCSPGATSNAVQTLYRLATVWLSAASIPISPRHGNVRSAIVQIFGPDYGSGGTAQSILHGGEVRIDVMAAWPQPPTLRRVASDRVLASTAAAFAANISLNLGLIPPSGTTGAAIAWSFSIVLMNLLAVIQVRRAWGIRAFDSTFLIVAAAASLCYGIGGLAGSQIGGQNLTTLLATGGLGTLFLRCNSFVVPRKARTWRPCYSRSWRPTRSPTADWELNTSPT